MPTYAITLSQMSDQQALNAVLRRSQIGKMSNRIPERIKIFQESDEYKLYTFKSRAFITFKDRCLALYRGNILYPEFSYDTVYEQIMASSDWAYRYQQNDGRFTYYYDTTANSHIDHEHPKRPPTRLYYNELRHSGGVICMLRAYQLSGKKKFLKAAKDALDWSMSICKEHETQWGKGYYQYYNKKSKLGGAGIVLVAAMHYRRITGDKCYDEYIKGFARHLLSRVDEHGEFYGYYINPAFQNGEPLLQLTEEEKKESFSFYYPGEALYGLAMFANHFDGDDELVSEVKRVSNIALDWIVDERPKFYGDMFTTLPSDGWLMQAIEEWAENDEYKRENLLNFVFNDADAMIERMYKRDDSPYIDYEGSYYYEYGDHYYPDGARSEGLIAAYYLAKKMKDEKRAKRILNACKKAAMNQFQLFNGEEYTYGHGDWEKSLGSIRFKSTRQWVRVDSIQHVACFFSRLYMTKKDYEPIYGKY